MSQEIGSHSTPGIALYWNSRPPAITSNGLLIYRISSKNKTGYVPVPLRNSPSRQEYWLNGNYSLPISKTAHEQWSAVRIWFYEKCITAMDVRTKQRVLIELLLLERSDDAKSVQRFWNISRIEHILALVFFDISKKSEIVTKNFVTKSAVDYMKMKLIGKFGISSGWLIYFIVHDSWYAKHLA
jgi:hypothetical protein